MWEDEETKVNYVEKIKNCRREKNVLIQKCDKLQEELEKIQNGMIGTIGTIAALAGKKEKLRVGYLFCDGTAYSREKFSDLFKIIGTNFGDGDGICT